MQLAARLELGGEIAKQLDLSARSTPACRAIGNCRQGT